MTDLPSGTVTFLFTDIEGSTALWERDRAAMAAAVVRHLTLLDAAIAAHGGVHFKTVGDAVQAAFPTAPDAVVAALAAQRAILGEDWGEIGELRVRMALHAGEAEPDARGDYLTAPLNRLSRLLATGYGSQILLTHAVQQLSRGALPHDSALRDLGQHRLRDLLEPERVFQVLHADLPSDFPPLRTLESRPNNLPRQPTPFLGREAEVDQVVELVRGQDVQLLTLTGPGGTGKTRLALQAAAELLDDFADGVFFVSLASLTDLTLVPSAIADTLGLREEAGQPLRERLRDFLAAKQLLLVLDNVEHLVDTAPDVGLLLETARGLKILVTSRVPLRLRAEREYPVAPLTLPRRAPPPALEEIAQSESARLFVDRAKAVHPDFAVNAENAPAIAEICWRLDGLPLAIELAAARVRIFSAPEMLEQLEKRLPFLTGGARDAPQRHRTLRDTIAWSYDLLAPHEQQLFRELSVFAGGIPLDAAEAVTSSGAQEDVPNTLERLVEHNLVRKDLAAPGESRFLLLETIREYGGEQLAASGAEDAARRSHATYFLRLACRAELSGPNAPCWLDRLETEYDNFRAALAWLFEAEPIEGMGLASQLTNYWLNRGPLEDGRAWLERALAVDDQVDSDVRLAVLQELASVAGQQGDYERAGSAAGEALGYARDLGDTTEEAMALRKLGVVASVRGNNAEAVALHEEALALHRKLDDNMGMAGVLTNLGFFALTRSNYDGAGTYLAEAEALTREADNVEYLAHVLELRGWLALKQDQYAQAAELLRESLAMGISFGDRWRVAETVRGFAEVARGIGQPERSARLHAAANAIRRQVGGALEPSERDEVAQSIAAIRGEISESSFAASWDAGTRLSLAEAHTEATALADELNPGSA